MFSLVLIVAIAVGYVLRRSELAGERDLRLTTAAELGAAHMAGILDGLSIATLAGDDPATTVEAIAATDESVGVCAFLGDDLTELSCAGAGPRPSPATVEEFVVGGVGTPIGGPLEVAVYESMMTIVGRGPELTIVAQIRTTAFADQPDVSVWAITHVPAASAVGGFAVEQGVRQTATAIPDAPGVFVVAAGNDTIELPADEQRFYLIIFSLAIVLLALAGVTLFVEQRNLLERASFDLLTRLPNRSEFERRAADVFAEAERHERGTCLLLFDLNDFKQVNDTHGHQAGDEMLRIVGDRLRKAVRDDDVVARWGGDEFVVLMPGIETEEMGGRRARQLADAISGRTRIDGIQDALRVKVSVGVAIGPRHANNLEQLVEAADQAMYQAKREGLTCWIADPVEPLEVTGV